MTEVFSLSSGKSFTTPGIFMYPTSQHSMDALYDVSYSDNLQNVDGLYFRSDNTKILNSFVHGGRLVEPPVSSDLKRKILMADPCLDIVLDGLVLARKKTLKNFFPKTIHNKCSQIIDSNQSTLDKDKSILEQLQISPFKPLLDFQTKYLADILLMPTIGLLTNRLFSARIKFNEQKLDDMHELVNRNIIKNKDTMNMITISPIVIREQNNHSSLIKLLLRNNPNFIGMRLISFNESDTVSNSALMKFLAELDKKIKQSGRNIPMHVIDIDELGYPTFCNGVINLISPIGRKPFAYASRGKRRIIKPKTRFNYYHPVDMDLQRLQDLALLPCHCDICSQKINARNILASGDPVKTCYSHWLCVKNMEINEFRSAKTRFDYALRDKLARSRRTALIAHIPNIPILNF